MEVTESYRILELEIGAPRAAVDAAYCRLVEKWHPDRAAASGPDAVREAQRMVQSINEAYHTLAKISPVAVKSPTPLPAQNSETASQDPVPAPAKPSSAPQAAAAIPATTPKNKPKLPPLTNGQPTLGHQPPPPPPPPADSWTVRPPVVSSSPPSPSVPPPTPPTSKPIPPPAPAARPALTTKTPSAAPAPSRPAPPAETAAAPAPPPSEPRKLPGLYDSLFPIGSPLRRFGPVILVAIVVVVLFLGKCAMSHSSRKTVQGPDPKTTGRLQAKANLANVTIAATRLAAPGDVSTASFSGATDQPLSGLPPGKYTVVAHADGWPEVHEEATVEVERTTDVLINFKGGSLRLDSDPTGATVRSGATVLGRTPLVIPQLPPGACQLTLEYPFWPLGTFNTTISEGVESTGLVHLPYGKLTVETALPGTTVLIGKRVLGKTPLTVDPFPAGTRKLTLQAKDFPSMEVPVTLEDHGDVKLRPMLGAVFPVLDPAVLLRSVWVREDEDRLAPPLEGVTGAFQSRNGIVKNLNRKLLSENWLQKRYRFTAIVKGYDPANGQIECVEQPNELSKFRIVAILAPDIRGDSDLIAQLVKGASLTLYGRLNAVEEPRWPSKVIMLEYSSVYPLR